ncbi:hypothetical protein D917_05795 [Trichinella nativa]|uniref:Uncharacterized protein n=1 Tax=Trichinella nativa TaxID=6335 RepID=A0A1Y3EV27_9BILA|nr:hypothetical protein D917_05795 [Trichinella nativa]
MFFFSSIFNLQKFGFSKHTLSAKIDEKRSLPLTVANDIFLGFSICRLFCAFEVRIQIYTIFELRRGKFSFSLHDLD